MASSTVTFGPASAPSEYSGQITSLQGSEVVANVSNGDGTTIKLDVRMNIDDSRVTGTVAAQEASN